MNLVEAAGDEPTDDYGLPTLYNMVYCSRVAAGVDKEAVDRIIAVAHRLNPVKGITGLLVFGGGIFFQWLEGPREHVKQLMINISRDARHSSIIPLGESEEVRERLFPDWAMELVATDDIRVVLEDALSTAEDAKNVQALRELLQRLENGQIDGMTNI